METHEYFQHGFSGHSDSLARRPLGHYSESRGLTLEQIRQKEREKQKKHSRMPYTERVDKEYFDAMRQVEKEESLAKLRTYNKDQISNGEAKRRMDMEARAALQQRDESLREQREEEKYAKFIHGTMPHNIGPKAHEKFAAKKRRTVTLKKGPTKRAELFEKNRNKVNPIQPESISRSGSGSRSRSVSTVEMSTGGSNFRISKSSRYTKKSKTAKKQKNKRKTMRR